MLKEMITPQDVVDLLNESFRLDSAATRLFRENKVKCNDALAEHPSIQIGENSNGNTLGILGFLNGLFGTNDNGYGCIAANYNENGKLIGFSYCATLGSNN